uniref:Uncharacterized protein n=1 Tax=Arion vulgaris TaxID=1028688 RepID=A0A0B6ZYZ9_9EUPU
METTRETEKGQTWRLSLLEELRFARLSWKVIKKTSRDQKVWRAAVEVYVAQGVKRSN